MEAPERVVSEIYNVALYHYSPASGGWDLQHPESEKCRLFVCARSDGNGAAYRLLAVTQKESNVVCNTALYAKQSVAFSSRFLQLRDRTHTYLVEMPSFFASLPLRQTLAQIWAGEEVSAVQGTMATGVGDGAAPVYRSAAAQNGSGGGGAATMHTIDHTPLRLRHDNPIDVIRAQFDSLVRGTRKESVSAAAPLPFRGNTQEARMLHLTSDLGSFWLPEVQARLRFACQTAFSRWDLGHSGFLSADQFVACMRELSLVMQCPTPTIPELDKLFKLLTKERPNNALSLLEFLSWWVHLFLYTVWSDVKSPEPAVGDDVSNDWRRGEFHGVEVLPALPMHAPEPTVNAADYQSYCRLKTEYEVRLHKVAEQRAEAIVQPSAAPYVLETVKLVSARNRKCCNCNEPPTWRVCVLCCNETCNSCSEALSLFELWPEAYGGYASLRLVCKKCKSNVLKKKGRGKPRKGQAPQPSTPRDAQNGAASLLSPPAAGSRTSRDVQLGARASILKSIAELEKQRGVMGDEVVDVALAPLYQKLAQTGFEGSELNVQSPSMLGATASSPSSSSSLTMSAADSIALLSGDALRERALAARKASTGGENGGGEAPVFVAGDEAQALHNQGMQARQEGNVEDAVQFFTSAIALDSTRASSYLERALCHNELAQHPEAIMDCDAVLALDDKSAPALGRRAIALARLGHLLEANAAFDAAFALDPTLPELREWPQVEKEMREAREHAASAQLARQEAVQAVKMHDYETALVACDRACAVEGSHAPTLAMRSNVHLKLGKPKKALADAVAALNTDPRFVLGWVRKGAALMALERRQEAEEAFRVASKIDPKHEEMLARKQSLLPDLALDGGSTDDLLDALSTAEVTQMERPYFRMPSSNDMLNKDGTFDVSHLQHSGEMLFSSNQPAAALERFDKLLQLHKHDLHARIYRAKCLVALSRQREALRDLDVVVRNEPKLVDALWLKTQTHYQLHDVPSALATCQRLLAVDAKHAKAKKLHRELKAEQEKDVASKEESLRRKLSDSSSALTSEMAASREAGGSFGESTAVADLLRKKQYMGALVELERRSPPFDAEHHRMRAEALNGLLRPEEALNDVRALMQLEPNASSAWRLKLDTLQRCERYEEALTACKQWTLQDSSVSLVKERRKLEKLLQGKREKARLSNAESAAARAAAKSFAKKGKDEEALEEYEKAVKCDTENALNYVERSTYHQKLGNMQSSLQDAERAVQLDTLYADAWLRLGDIQMALDDKEKAFFAYEKAAEINPKVKNSKVHKTLRKQVRGGTLRSSGRSRSNSLSKGPVMPSLALGGLSSAPDAAAALSARTLAESYLEKGKAEDALPLLNDAIEREPSNPAHYEKRADAYCDMGEYAKALADAGKAVELDPMRASAQATKGKCAGFLGHTPVFEECFDLAARLDPKLPLLKQRKKLEKAFKKGRSGDPVRRFGTRRSRSNSKSEVAPPQLDAAATADASTDEASQPQSFADKYGSIPGANVAGIPVPPSAQQHMPPPAPSFAAASGAPVAFSPTVAPPVPSAAPMVLPAAPSAPPVAVAGGGGCPPPPPPPAPVAVATAKPLSLAEQLAAKKLKKASDRPTREAPKQRNEQPNMMNIADQIAARARRRAEKAKQEADAEPPVDAPVAPIAAPIAPADVPTAPSAPTAPVPSVTAPAAPPVLPPVAPVAAPATLPIAPPAAPTPPVAPPAAPPAAPPVAPITAPKAPSAPAAPPVAPPAAPNAPVAPPAAPLVAPTAPPAAPPVAPIAPPAAPSVPVAPPAAPPVAPIAAPKAPSAPIAPPAAPVSTPTAPRAPMAPPAAPLAPISPPAAPSAPVASPAAPPVAPIAAPTAPSVPVAPPAAPPVAPSAPVAPPAPVPPPAPPVAPVAPAAPAPPAAPISPPAAPAALAPPVAPPAPMAPPAPAAPAAPAPPAGPVVSGGAPPPPPPPSIKAGGGGGMSLMEQIAAKKLKKAAAAPAQSSPASGAGGLMAEIAARAGKGLKKVERREAAAPVSSGNDMMSELKLALRKSRPSSAASSPREKKAESPASPMLAAVLSPRLKRVDRRKPAASQELEGLARVCHIFGAQMTEEEVAALNPSDVPKGAKFPDKLFAQRFIRDLKAKHAEARDAADSPASVPAEPDVSSPLPPTADAVAVTGGAPPPPQAPAPVPSAPAVHPSPPQSKSIQNGPKPAAVPAPAPAPAPAAVAPPSGSFPEHDRFCKLMKAPPTKLTPELAGALDIWDVQERGMSLGLKGDDLNYCKEHVRALKEGKFKEKIAAANAAAAAAVPAAAPTPVPGAKFRKKAAPVATTPSSSPKKLQLGKMQWPAKIPPFELPEGYEKFKEYVGEMDRVDMLYIEGKDLPSNLSIPQKIWIKKYLRKVCEAAQAAIDARAAKGPPPPGHERFCTLYGQDLEYEDVLELTEADIPSTVSFKNKIWMKKHLNQRKGIVNPNLIQDDEENEKPAWMK